MIYCWHIVTILLAYCGGIMVNEQVNEQEKRQLADQTENKEKKSTREGEGQIKGGRLLKLIFKEKPSKILLLLLDGGEWNISKLARESKQSYVYAFETINKFEKEGIIYSKFNGKKREIKLTENGEKIARLINELMKS